MKRSLLALLVLFALLPATAEARSTQIINGSPVEESEWQFFTTLSKQEITSTADFPFCGGALIDPEWVLTAAHCAETMATIHLGIGTTNRYEPVPGEKQVSRNAYMHPRWTVGQPYAYDFALIKLPRPSLMPTVPLSDRPLQEGDPVRVAGFGTQTEGQFDIPDQILETTVSVRKDEYCLSRYGLAYAGRSMFCAEAPGTDSCQGDSGSPVVKDSALVGMASWGHGCALARYPGVYSELAEARPWIEQVISRGYQPGQVTKTILFGNDRRRAIVASMTTQRAISTAVRFKKRVCFAGRCWRAGRWIAMGSTENDPNYQGRMIRLPRGKCLQGRIRATFARPNGSLMYSSKSVAGCNR